MRNLFRILHAQGAIRSEEEEFICYLEWVRPSLTRFNNYQYSISPIADGATGGARHSLGACGGRGCGRTREVYSGSKNLHQTSHRRPTSLKVIRFPSGKTVVLLQKIPYRSALQPARSCAETHPEGTFRLRCGEISSSLPASALASSASLPFARPP